jgi:hypothetical protein
MIKSAHQPVRYSQKRHERMRLLRAVSQSSGRPYHGMSIYKIKRYVIFSLYTLKYHRQNADLAQLNFYLVFATFSLVKRPKTRYMLVGSRSHPIARLAQGSFNPSHHFHFDFSNSFCRTVHLFIRKRPLLILAIAHCNNHGRI